MAPKFVTSDERNVAEVLDSYEIAWRYEPRTFELEHHPDGSLKSAFTPDFYLPDHDVYVEVTSVSSMQRKNKKMRLMGRYWPKIKVVLLAKNDLARLFATLGS